MRRSRSRRFPAKLKTSFEPVLGPAIARKIAADDRASVAKQVRQVTYWIIAAQLGIALALGIPGRAVMGLVGSGFTGGTAMLGFLLAAEVIAATAVVSEAALIYVARTQQHDDQPHHARARGGARGGADPDHAGARVCRWRSRRPGPAIGLCIALAFASITKSRLLQREARRAGLRLALGSRLGDGGGLVVGAAVRLFLPRDCCS